MAFDNPYQDAIDKILPDGYRMGTGWMDEFERKMDYYKASKIPVEKHVEAHMTLFSQVRMAREKMVSRYSWAIPTEEAIVRIAKLSPIIDWCAGTGYWAWLLRQMGADVEAWSTEPGMSHHHQGRNGNAEVTLICHTTIRKTTGKKNHIKEVFSRTFANTLLLVWPPYDDTVASRCVESFRGQYVVHVGENGGCTGDERFHQLLENGFEEVECINIPSWDGLHDDVWIWERKTRRSISLEDE